MTSLIAVSSHLPGTVPVGDLRSVLGLTDAQVRRFTRLYGLAEICLAPELSETELLLAAASGLQALRGQEDRVRYVVRAKGLRTTAPYPLRPAHEVCEALGLTRATPVAVADHGCATGLLALDVCSTLLAEDGDPDALALILAGDKTFTPFTQWVANVSIMGEGSAAVLVGASGDRDRVLGYGHRTHGRIDGLVDVTPETASWAMSIYQDALAEVVRAATARAGIEVGDLALVLPHNVNRVSWTVAASRWGLPNERIFLDNLARTGHCFCADPFINLGTASATGRLEPGDRYLMTAAGLGQAFSAMVLEH